ncbi:hypothetical protein QBC41DRAFT_393225 [Cercophora samala]|uniref:Uncharacterized protein n=1 Tax=Cercophora samala TaxID=330535 RepID=A0AA39ZD79_9PEZI|nr:hypothetical protein QBC41DRAFT_393225 [Cercophora samala]
MLPNIALALYGLLGFIGIASASPSLLGNYTVVDVQWDLPTNLSDPNSATISVLGTIQEAVAQMEAQYPGWNATFQNQQPSNATVSTVAQYDVEGYLCGKPWSWVGYYAVLDGIYYLRKVTSAAPKNGPGPGNCGRVSCGYKAAIYWCNDNGAEKELDSWNDIADGAQYVFDKCVDRDDKYAMVAGQVFYTDKWNVIVTFESC